MKKNTLVFTDLDGTLLDHYTYQTDDAEETLSALKFHDIAIIPNSSKTLPEILLIRQQLRLSSPFIIENGAAVYIPINTFTSQPSGTHIQDGFWVKPFSNSTQHWVSLLNKHGADYKGEFQGFSEMDSKKVASLTGLSLENAQMAKQRQFGEPLNWLGSETRKSEFIEHMQSLDVKVLQGGRFLHISGDCDKGKAQQWLTKQYQQQVTEKEVVTIALGDGDNDVDMLEVATIAVQIKSPVHDFPRLKRTENVYKSRQYGPAGWAECLHEIILSKLIH